MSSTKGSRAVRSILTGTLIMGVVVSTQAPAASAGKPQNIPPVTLPVTPGTCYLSINDVTVGEGSGHALLTVSLTTCALAVSVQYATQNGTAVAGSDYAARAGTLTFARRETSKTIAVPIINDSSPEGHETFSVRLSSASKAAIADSTGAVTIQDDDVPGPCSPMPQCLL